MKVKIESTEDILFNTIELILLKVLPASVNLLESILVSVSVNVAVPEASVNEASRNQTSLVVDRLPISMLNDAFISDIVLPVYDV